MGSLGVRRMVKEDDRPGAAVRGEIGREPDEHRRAGHEARVGAVERHQVNLPVVERVPGLRLARQAAGLAGARQREAVVIRPGERRRIRRHGVVVAERRPERRGPERFGIHVEDRGLVLRVGSAEVGVVAEHQPEIGLEVVREEVVTVAHRRGIEVGAARVAEHPDPRRTPVSGGARRPDPVCSISAGEDSTVVADRVVGRRVHRQPGELNTVFGRCGGDRRLTRILPGH